MPLVVHGLVAAERARSTDTRAMLDELEHTVELVEHRDVTAITSPTAESELAPSRANMMAHTRILEAFGERMTVVPMRFGVLVPDGATLADAFLEPQHDDVLGQLDRLAGRVELRLRGRYDEQRVIGEVMNGDRRAARLQGREDLDAKLELGRRVTAGIEARRDHDATRVAEALQPVVEAVAPGRVAEPLDAFTLSLLVHRDRLDEFDDLVDRLAGAVAPLLELELVGPLPPFSFTGGAA